MPRHNGNDPSLGHQTLGDRQINFNHLYEP